MKYPWPLWVYPILLACLGQSGFCLLGLLWPKKRAGKKGPRKPLAGPRFPEG